MTKATVSKPVRTTAASAPQAESSDALPVWKTQHNRVQGALWRHPQLGGKVRYTVSISRSYKDSETNKWVNVHYFDQRDLRDVITVASEARDQILELDGLTTEPGED